MNPLSTPLSSTSTLMCFILSCLVLNLSAQYTITGKVLDAENKEPLIGANIIQKGTANGTITDIDGSFTFNLHEKPEQIISILYTGYYQKEISVNKELTEKLIIELEQTHYGECAVISHFPFSEGALKKINPESGENIGLLYASQLLQNEVAGLIVSRPGDDPNEGFLFRLRGISSFLMRTTPLIVVDGLPGVSLRMIDPNDISEIKVLKDAASSAKYGIMGHAGVIEVTTHQPQKNDGLNLQYNTYLSGHTLGREIPLADIETFVKANGEDYGDETDWVEEITRNTFSHAHHLIFSNKHKPMRYTASGGFKSNNGILNDSGFEQINGRVSFNSHLNKKINISGNLAYTKRDANYSIKNVFQSAIRANPTAPVRSNDPSFDEHGGYFHPSGFRTNPVATIAHEGNLERIKEKTGYVKLTYHLNTNQKIFTDANYSKKENIRGYNRLHEHIYRARRDKGEINHSRLNTTVGHEYSDRIRRINLGQTTGIGFYRSLEKTKYQNGSEIINSEKLSFSNLGDPPEKYAAKVNTDLDGEAGHKVYSFFSNTKIFGGPWEFNAHLRHEGLTYFLDEDFNNDINYHLFYGATIGLNLTDLFNLRYFSEGKFRLGYGKTGGIYEIRNKLNQKFRYVSDQNENVEWTPINMKEHDIIKSKWEEKKEINAGLDFVLYYGKIVGSFDFYHNNVNEIMVKNSWWLTAFGDVSNSGIEAEINIAPIQTNNFSWETNFLFSTNKSIIRRFSTTADLQEEYGFIWLENNKAAGLVYAFDNEKELKNGSFVPVDKNGDGRIRFEDDAKIIGSGFPKVNLSWQNHFTFGNFYFSFKLRSMLGHKLLNGHRLNYETNNARNSNIVMTKYFRHDLTQASETSYGHYFEKGDFLKLDYLNIGYLFETKKLDCTIYFAGQNLLTWTGYTGLDPEPRYFFDANPLIPSVEFEETYFRNKTVTVGLQIKY